MGPKRGASGSLDEPARKSPKKRAAPQIQLEASSEHPTIARLKAILKKAKVKSFLQGGVRKLSSSGGIDPFNPSHYAASMGKTKEYTCLVPVLDVDPLATAHHNLVPSWTSLLRLGCRLDMPPLMPTCRHRC